MADRDSCGRFILGHSNLSRKGVHIGMRTSLATEFKKGMIPWNKGELITLQCKACNKEFECYPCEVGRKKFCSKECFFKGRELKQTFQTGAKHRFYIDGRAGLGYTHEFTRNKKKALARDNYICQICRKDEHRLEVHHKDYDRTHNDIENLTTLCRVCHARTNFSRDYWQRLLVGGGGVLCQIATG